MMEYEVFKNVIAARIKEFLPPIYADFDINMHNVPKINGSKEAMILQLELEDRVMTAPNIYMDDLYQDFREHGNIDDILKETASVIITFTGTQYLGENEYDITEYKTDIVKALINTEKNRKLLEEAPHTNFLDLSVIYRFAVKEDGGGYATALLTHDLQKELGLTDEQLDLLAQENTDRKLQTKIIALSDKAAIMTVEDVIYGAINLLRKNELKKLADQMKDDLYLVPSSMHEIMVIKAGIESSGKLTDLLKMGNQLNIDEEEYLSDNIYFYDRNKNVVCLVESE